MTPLQHSLSQESESQAERILGDLSEMMIEGKRVTVKSAKKDGGRR